MATTAALRASRTATASTATEGSKTPRQSTASTVLAVAKAAGPLDELRQALHWTRPDGTPCFTPDRDAALTESTWSRLNQWVRDSGDAELKKLARAAGNRNGKPAAQSKGIPKPAPSYQSIALRRSVLRTDWSPGAAQVAIDWATPEMRFEFCVGRDVIFQGLAPPEVVVGRQRLQLGQWSESYWVPDKEADALELKMSLGGDLLLERQIVLSRRDGLLWIADAVTGASRGKLEVAVSLPLAVGASVVEAVETREASLTVGRRKLLVVPPALAEWRVERRVDEVTTAAGAVSLRQTHEHAVAAYAPLCIVYDSRRARRPCTWRQLTIGENLEIQPRDRAAGYRLQLGNENWVVYRSLTPRANRSLFGINLQDDFLMARLQKNGTVKTLMGIEDD